MRVLARLLVEAGALPAETGDGEADIRRTFDAQAYADVLADVAELVGPLAMAKAMGATLRELTSRQMDGVLRPWSRDPSVRAPWRTADGLTLVTELTTKAIPVAPDAPGWERLQHARARTRSRLNTLIGAVRSGHLIQGSSTADETTGPGRTYHDLVVQRAEVDALLKRRRAENEAAPPPSAMSAAEFGQSVGL